MQQALMRQWENRSKKDSFAATAPALAYLDSAEIRGQLRACCPTIARESAEELLHRITDELRTAELVHNFRAERPPNKVGPSTHIA